MRQGGSAVERYASTHVSAKSCRSVRSCASLSVRMSMHVRTHVCKHLGLCRCAVVRATPPEFRNKPSFHARGRSRPRVGQTKTTLGVSIGPVWSHVELGLSLTSIGQIWSKSVQHWSSSAHAWWKPVTRGRSGFGPNLVKIGKASLNSA